MTGRRDPRKTSRSKSRHTEKGKEPARTEYKTLQKGHDSSALRNGMLTQATLDRLISTNHEPSSSSTHHSIAQSHIPVGPSSSSAANYESMISPSYTPTTKPSTMKSTFKTARDTQMAKLQTKYNTLSPADKAKQEAWAQSQLLLNAGNCVAGWSWVRLPGGYMCQGRGHFVTDELLSEGLGGCYVNSQGRPLLMTGVRYDGEYWDGPFYGDDIKGYERYALAFHAGRLGGGGGRFGSGGGGGGGRTGGQYGGLRMQHTPGGATRFFGR